MAGTFAGCLGSVSSHPLAESSANPIEISDVDELQAMQDDLTADYVLVDNIDASETEDWNDGKGFEPIGDVDFQFMGTLDGRGFVIEELYIDRPDESFVGLFGYIHEGGEVEDIGLKHSSATGRSYVGILSGKIRGTVSNSYSTGEVSALNLGGGLLGTTWIDSSLSNSYSTVDVTGDQNLGGLVGRSRGDIHDCFATGDVDGGDTVGGLVGYNWGNLTNSEAKGDVVGNSQTGGLVGYNRWSEISGSYATGNVSGGDETGGLIGFNDGSMIESYASGDVLGNSLTGGIVGKNEGQVEDSYATGDVNGYESVGGLIGYNDSEGDVTQSYSTGKVTGESHIGGLVGWNMGEVEDCFWDVESSGINESAAGIGKTKDKMKEIGTFEDNGWEIKITDEADPTNGYPFLSWQLSSSPTWYIFGELFEVTISIEGGGSTDPVPNTYTYAEGEDISIEAIPDTGWEFAGWTGDVETEDQEIEITVTEDMEVVSEFTRKEFELTVDIKGEGTTSIPEGIHTYEFEDEVELEATPEDGWEFAGWTGDVESEAASITVAIEEDMEIIAHFSQEDTPTPTPTPSPTPGEPTPTPTPPSDDPTPSPTPVDDDGIPGPGIVGTVGSLVGAGYVLKWWSEKQDEGQE